jgi:hypothetical protein
MKSGSICARSEVYDNPEKYYDQVLELNLINWNRT